MKGVIVSITILYILVLALFGWLSYACYCDLKFDANSSAGLIVSALCVLVTALVGWQIYSLIDLKQIRAEREALRRDVDVRIHRLHINLYSTAVANSKGSIQVNDSNYVRKVEFLVFMNYLRLFYHKIYLEEFDECNEQIKLMFNDIERRKNLILTKDEYILICQLISKNEEICKVKNFTPVRSLTDMFNYIEVINREQDIE